MKCNVNIPKKKILRDIINSGVKHKHLIDLATYISLSETKGHIIESFIIIYQIMQDLFLTDLIFKTIKLLKLDDIEDEISNQQKAYNLNLEYVTLSHDLELYRLLERARKIRNEITHKLISDESFDVSQKKARDGFKLVKQIIKEINDRLKGDKSIPVLTLYPRGWNDCLSQFHKNLGLDT